MRLLAFLERSPMYVLYRSLAGAAAAAGSSWRLALDSPKKLWAAVSLLANQQTDIRQRIVIGTLLIMALTSFALALYSCVKG